jgi:hypothetical protein
MRDETKIQLNQCMIRDKSFLKSLYLSNPVSNRTTLAFAQKRELLTLIKVLFFMSRGEIPIKKVHYQNLIKSKKRDALHRIYSIQFAKYVIS